MTFLALPRELRDHIYAHLTPSDQTYSITSTKEVTTIEAFDTSEPNLGIINTCKTIQYETLEIICRNNTFRFSFPDFDSSAQSLYHELAPLMTHIDLYIDFGTFPWDRFRDGHRDPEISSISDRVSEALIILNNDAKICKSCRIIIKDRNKYMSPLLRLQFFETVKSLVDVDTLMIVLLKWKPDMRKLGAVLAPSLGPSTLHYEWPLLLWAKWDYGCVQFHPKKFLAGREKYQVE